MNPTEAGFYWGYWPNLDESTYNVIVEVTGKAPFLRLYAHCVGGSGSHQKPFTMDATRIAFGPRIDVPVSPPTTAVA